MTCLIIKLVMVALGVHSALVMVALVLNLTPCRRPGMRVCGTITTPTKKA